MSDLQILARSFGQCTAAALIQNGTLLEYHEESTGETETLVGSVRIGRVERVLKDLGAAFVDIGLSKNGFLPIRESDSFQQLNPSALLTGSDVVVQIKKDPVGGKGAFLTRDVVLPGQYVMIMPYNRYIGVSKRIQDANQIAALKEKGKKIAKQQFGIVMRANSLYCSDDDACEEAQALWQRWSKAVQNASCQKSPAVLLSNHSVLSRMAEDYCGRHGVEVFCSEQTDVSSLPENCTVTFLDEEALQQKWSALRIEKQLQAALSKEIKIADGPVLVFDECEALTAIDVNSGKDVFSTEGDLAFRENMAAVKEVARQIQLRNLSGIIIVDFINMQTEQEKQAVLTAMEAALQNDRTKTVIHGFTSLGLLEITRKRMSNSLLRTCGERCTACNGTGHLIRKNEP